MNMKKALCLMLALLMTLGAFALAEGDDLQALLDDANARIAELEAEVELYKPFYDKQIVATFGEDGIIWRDDAQAQYEAVASMYSQYGISVDAYASEIKQDLLESMVERGVLAEKADELGLSNMDDETLAGIQEQAESEFNSYIEAYKGYFTQDGMSDEQIIATTSSYLADNGLTVDVLVDELKQDYVDEQLHTYVTGDITVSDEEIQAAYEKMVAEDSESYTDDYSFNSARTSGETIAWYPEGYRAVKHVLIKFDDEQSSTYSSLKTAIADLQSELAELENPEEAEEAIEEAAEEGEAPRTAEEIQTDLSAAQAEMDALYAQLLPRAQEVIDAFNSGADFDSLIAEYGEDPGMKSGFAAENGYAVSAESTYWDPAFRDGAMNIEAVGQISEPVYGTNGIHIIYYLADITPGAAPFEDVAEAAEEAALSEKVSAAYTNQVDAWVQEAAPEYYIDRF